MNTRKTLRALLKKDEVLITTCAHDALSAKIIEQAGIPALITTGFGISASHIGQPDAERKMNWVSIDRDKCTECGLCVSMWGTRR